MGEKEYFLINLNDPLDVLYKMILAVERANGSEPGEWKHEKVLKAYVSIVEIMMLRKEITEPNRINNIKELVAEKIVYLVTETNKQAGHDWEEMMEAGTYKGEEIKVIKKEALEEAMQEMMKARTPHDSQN